MLLYLRRFLLGLSSSSLLSLLMGSERGKKNAIFSDDEKEVMNDFRLKASYLRYDLSTVISAKPKEEKKPLKELTGKLFATIDQLDHAAKIKSHAEAEKYYAETKSTLDDVIAKL